MTSFSLIVQTVCLVLLSGLMFYTLWLMRSGRLNAHVTVRWVLVECAGIFAVVLWKWLPLFKYTSALGDRALLMILAVVFFVLIAFLMLDCLVRISTHTTQVKRLTQELALLRTYVEPVGKEEDSTVAKIPVIVPNVESFKQNNGDLGKRDMLLIFWIVACLGLYLWDIYPGYPETMKAFFTASYQH